MGIFATLVRRGAHAEVRANAEPDAKVLQFPLPARFEAVGERLAAGHDASSACAVVGRETARDGADLGEALDGLRTTYARVQGGEPDFRALRALCLAWSEETLRYMHQLSCEDPLTGLASLAHVRARLSEVYRGAEQGGDRRTPAMPWWWSTSLCSRSSCPSRAARWRPDSSQPSGWPRWPTPHARFFRGERRSRRPARRGWSWSPNGGTCSPGEWGCCAVSSRIWAREGRGRGSGSRGCRRPTTALLFSSTRSRAVSAGAALCLLDEIARS